MSFHLPAHKQPSAHDALGLFVARAKLAHPELGLSFGYVGNVYRDGTDDRSWRVFTNRRDDAGRSVSYWLGDTKNLSDALMSIPFRWEAFVSRALSSNRI